MDIVRRLRPRRICSEAPRRAETIPWHGGGGRGRCAACFAESLLGIIDSRTARPFPDAVAPAPNFDLSATIDQAALLRMHLLRNRLETSRPRRHEGRSR